MASLCREPFTNLQIKMDGSVYACNGGQYIGNLKLNSAEELWNCTRIIELRRQLTENNFDSVCFKCGLYDNKSVFNYQTNKKPINIRSLKKIDHDLFYDDLRIDYVNRVYGFIDYSKSTKDKTVIEGWVIDRGENKPAKYVVLLVNSSYFDHVPVDIKRSDVSSHLNDKSLEMCGFKLETSFISVEKKIDIVAYSSDDGILGVISA
jgi:radical SAM protein with 4Fe4S-binding SPASM domain